MNIILNIISKNVTIIAVIALLISSCKGKVESNKAEQAESKEAKALLQGIWVDSESESVAFMAKGDTIYYPDSTLVPVRFAIYGDTLVLHATNITKYGILKQSQNIFSFNNGMGDEVKLVRSTDEEQDKLLFVHKEVMAINQGVKIDRDSIVLCGNVRYHIYTTVNPTSYKVFKRTYNEDGLEVENVYYDNIVHLSVFDGNRKVYSGDFRKEHFAKYIEGFNSGSLILSDINYTRSKNDALFFEAVIGEPDGISNYVVGMSINNKGNLNIGGTILKADK